MTVEPKGTGERTCRRCWCGTCTGNRRRHKPMPNVGGNGWRSPRRGSFSPRLCILIRHKHLGFCRTTAVRGTKKSLTVQGDLIHSEPKFTFPSAGLLAPPSVRQEGEPCMRGSGATPRHVTVSEAVAVCHCSLEAEASLFPFCRYWQHVKLPLRIPQGGW